MALGGEDMCLTVTGMKYRELLGILKSDRKFLQKFS